MRSAAPVFVFVVSEMSPVLVERWVAGGKLPFFARMARTGSAGALRAHFPFVTVQAFADIFTGRRAQQHGIFDYLQRGEDGRFREATRDGIRCDALWDLLERAGRSCGLVNLPLNWPPRELRGYMIAGQDSPVADRTIAAPPALYDALTRKLGRYRLKDIFPGGRHKHDYLALFPEELAWQEALLAELVSEHRCDFFMTFLSAAAMAQHYFWTDMEQAAPGDPYAGLIEAVYRGIDAQLGRLAERAGAGARIFVISECGAGPLKYGVDLNAWLQQNGFLHYRTSAAQTRWRAELVETLLKTAKRHLPERLKSLAARRLPALKAQSESYLAVSEIDWSATCAYSRGKEGAIFVNLAGREPHGSVAPGQPYEDVVARLTQELCRLVDPDTGEAAVVGVHRREELYPGCRHPGAPDLLVEWVDAKYMPTETQRRSAGPVFGPRWRANMRWPTSGSHRDDGIFFAQGPGIEAGHRVADATTLDLLPTWLRMLDVPLPADLPGQVLEYCCGEAPLAETTLSNATPA